MKVLTLTTSMLCTNNCVSAILLKHSYLAGHRHGNLSRDKQFDIDKKTMFGKCIASTENKASGA